jgi:hypothetical protein
MWWKMTKTIFVSWFVGVICGVGIVIAVQQENRMPASESAGSHLPAQTTTGMTPDETTRN